MSRVKEFPLSEEYKKDTGVTAEDVRMFREWLSTQPHLPTEHITDLDLILTYHSCERSLSVSKQVLDLHYTLKTHLNGFFKDRVFDARMERSLNIGLMAPLPTRTKEGYACFYAKTINTDPKIYNFNDVVRSFFMVSDLWQYEDGTWPGLIIVMDLDGMTFGHLPKIELHTLQQYIYFLQEAMFVRLKSLHFINAPYFVDKLMMLVRPLLKKSLLEVFYIHQPGSKTLEDFFPMDALPKDCGGLYKSLYECRDDIIARLRANSEFFLLESKKRVCESRRPGKPKTVTDFFGSVEGSFKKLDID